MAIELPTWEDPADRPHLPPQDAYDTIGEFYHSLAYGLTQVYGAKGAAWPKAAGAQVSGNFDDDAFPVKDLASAEKAIGLIILQGEGASKANPDDDVPHEKAHYYQMQALVGKLGAGDVIPSVRNVAGLTWSARCGALLDFFDACYSAMLRQLEGNFRGEGEASATIFGSMTALGALAAYVMQVDYAPAVGASGAPTGKLTPRFRYVKTAPQAAYDAIKEPADAQSPAVKGMLGALPATTA
jgi:hypothetical protein